MYAIGFKLPNIEAGTKPKLNLKQKSAYRRIIGIRLK